MRRLSVLVGPLQKLGARLGHTEHSVGTISPRVRLELLERAAVSNDVTIAYSHPATGEAIKRLDGHRKRRDIDCGGHCPFRLGLRCWTTDDTCVFGDFARKPGSSTKKLDALARLTIPYSHGTPILTLALKGPEGVRSIAGVLDSGADKTLLPKSFALKLGIPPEDLQPTPEGSGGAGNAWFPTWELSYPIEALVMVPYAQPRGAEPWGPSIALIPEFATDTIPLFGRADFFEVFTVTMDQPGGNVFHLDYRAVGP